MLVHAAYALSPREQLNQMVEQLQKSPNDNALREKIIQLARSLKLAQLATPDRKDIQVLMSQVEDRHKEMQEMKSGKIIRDCPDCPEMVILPAGSFDMGSHDGVMRGEQPVHRVTIGKAFAMGKTEVTQGQWRAVMGNNPSYFSACGDTCPVEQVSWDDAQEFIRKLNAKTGKQYRLPSEAEWEYACRAGGEQEYCGSDNVDSVGWFTKDSGNKTHPVGSKQPNAFGLYDMSGNVWEWVEDSDHGSYAGATTDDSAWPGDGKLRMLRGGSWGALAIHLRSTYPLRARPTNWATFIGFRCAQDVR